MLKFKKQDRYLDKTEEAIKTQPVGSKTSADILKTCVLVWNEFKNEFNSYKGRKGGNTDKMQTKVNDVPVLTNRIRLLNSHSNKSVDVIIDNLFDSVHDGPYEGVFKATITAEASPAEIKKAADQANEFEKEYKEKFEKLVDAFREWCELNIYRLSNQILARFIACLLLLLGEMKDRQNKSAAKRSPFDNARNIVIVQNLIDVFKECAARLLDICNEKKSLLDDFQKKYSSVPQNQEEFDSFISDARDLVRRFLSDFSA